MDEKDPTTQRIQKINLETYKAFSKLCKKNNLKYFAVSGTSIGAHFWQGFIPWDDDMDIGMPIEDFEKFRKSTYKQLPKEYGFIELPELGGKIYNKNTTLIEAPYAYSPNHYYGVFIDIVPLIGLPDDKDERRQFAYEMQNYIVEASTVDRATELSIFTGQKTKTIKAKRAKLAFKYPFGATKYCTDFSCIKCPPYLTQGFLNPIESSFEDTTIPTSSEQEHDLKVAYGNLIKNVPPSERRLVHHNFYAYCDLDTPCEAYIKEYKRIKMPAWFKDITYKNHLYGISSARETGLYKILCKKLEQQLTEERLNHQNEMKLIRTSTSFKLGNRLIKPLSTIKNLLNKKT